MAEMKVPSKIDCAMATAMVWSLRTKCLHHQVGCCAINPKGRIVSIGYNGPVSGDTHCTDAGCAKDGQAGMCRGAHAEINTIINATHPDDLEGTILCCTEEPCFGCAKAIVTAGIKQVFFLRPYIRVPSAANGRTSEHEQVEEFFGRTGVKLAQYQSETEINVVIAEGRSQ